MFDFGKAFAMKILSGSSGKHAKAVEIITLGSLVIICVAFIWLSTLNLEITFRCNGIVKLSEDVETYVDSTATMLVVAEVPRKHQDKVAVGQKAYLHQNAFMLRRSAAAVGRVVHIVEADMEGGLDREMEVIVTIDEEGKYLSRPEPDMEIYIGIVYDYKGVFSLLLD
jgi:hypothetical protein